MKECVFRPSSAESMSYVHLPRSRDSHQPGVVNMESEYGTCRDEAKEGVLQSKTKKLHHARQDIFASLPACLKFTCNHNDSYLSFNYKMQLCHRMKSQSGPTPSPLSLSFSHRHSVCSRYPGCSSRSFYPSCLRRWLISPPSLLSLLLASSLQKSSSYPWFVPIRSHLLLSNSNHVVYSTLLSSPLLSPRLNYCYPSFSLTKDFLTTSLSPKAKYGTTTSPSPALGISHPRPSPLPAFQCSSHASSAPKPAQSASSPSVKAKSTLPSP